jgi:hypothetical protein
MLEHGISPEENITRHAMEREQRLMEDKAFRNIRDFIIYRGVMNCLEYIIQVFE